MDNFLNIVILAAPPKYLAGIPYAQRKRLMLLLSSQFVSGALDYQNKWLSYSSDNPYEDVSRCRFWVKLLPRKADSPLVFIYMAIPFSGEAPSSHQTYILDGGENDWRDVTNAVLPRGIDLKEAFVPRRWTEDIQVAGYRKTGVTDSKGRQYYDFGDCRLILHWNGTSFERRTVESRKLEFDNK